MRDVWGGIFCVLKKLRKTSYKDSESYDNIMIKREYLNGFIEYDNRKEERCMRKMRTLFLVLLCCGLSLYAGGILCEGRGKGSF